MFRLVTFWFASWLFSFCQFSLFVEQHQGFRHPIWVCLFIFFLLAKCIRWRCLPCRGVSKVKGCPSCFWDPLLVFCPNTFLSISLFPPYQSFDVNLLLLTWPSCMFMGDYWAQGLWIAYRPLECANKFLSPSFMGWSSSFSQSPLCWWPIWGLNTCGTYHCC